MITWTCKSFDELTTLELYAILRLRTNELEIGTWLLRTEGDVQAAAAYDAFLLAHRDHWLRD